MGDLADGFLSPHICREAEAILAGGPAGGSAPEPGPDSEGLDLLDALGYPAGTDPSDGGGATLANRQALLRLAARLRRLFRISPPDAPNLVFLGGEADAGSAGGADGAHGTVSLAGAGLSLGQAFERCVGEGAEYLSQIPAETDRLRRARPSDASHGLGGGEMSDVLAMLDGEVEAADPEIDWVSGRRFSGADPIRLPADLCLRRPESRSGILPRVGVGSGCAAGPTEETATVSAVLELIERDAAALWWWAGRPARPISLEVSAAVGADTLLRHVRAGAASRHSWLLDITTDLGIPCVASISLAGDGGGFACGLSAGLSIGTAIRSAIVEMCQMELSHHIIALKRRQRGEGALNRHDLAQIERARLVGADTPIIQPKGLPNDWRVSTEEPTAPEIPFQSLLGRAEELGVNIYVVNLTRDWLAIPVSKVIATGLQPYPSEFETSRLAKAIEQYRDTNNSAQRIPLL